MVEEKGGHTGRLEERKREESMKLTPTSSQSLYVEMDGWTFYIDNGTNEQIVHLWKDSWPEDTVDELNPRTSRLDELPGEQQAKLIILINSFASLEPSDKFALNLIESTREKLIDHWQLRMKAQEKERTAWGLKCKCPCPQSEICGLKDKSGKGIHCCQKCLKVKKEGRKS